MIMWEPSRVLRSLPALILAALLAACAVPGGPTPGGPTPAPAAWQSARMVKPPSPLQCVPFTRERSGLQIYGDAWTWWRAAEGHFLRTNRPSVGSVLVLRRTGRLHAGHLAVVTRVVNSRQVIVDHANWLNRGMVHVNAPVIDVSAANDWSVVRVWYIPGDTLGARAYPAHGFIHPRRIAAVPGAAS